MFTWFSRKIDRRTASVLLGDNVCACGNDATHLVPVAPTNGLVALCANCAYIIAE